MAARGSKLGRCCTVVRAEKNQLKYMTSLMNWNIIKIDFVKNLTSEDNCEN